MGQARPAIVMHFEDEEARRYFPIVLNAKEGHIGEACKALGITRRRYQRWIDEDPEFAIDCQGAMESLIDMTQSKLVENIKDNQSRDIQFFLKTQGRHRGYGEKVEHEHSGLVGHTHLHGWYPPEPQTIAEWETQITEAEKRRKQRANPAIKEICEGKGKLYCDAIAAPTLSNLPQDQRSRDSATDTMDTYDQTDQADQTDQDAGCNTESVASALALVSIGQGAS